MDPKLHALIPLASGVALAFSTGCSKDETEDPFLAFCEKAAECSSEAIPQAEIQQCADYFEGASIAGGEACHEAAKALVQCAVDKLSCDELYDYDVSSECTTEAKATDAACGSDYSYSYDY